MCLLSCNPRIVLLQGGCKRKKRWLNWMHVSALVSGARGGEHLQLHNGAVLSCFWSKNNVIFYDFNAQSANNSKKYCKFDTHQVRPNLRHFISALDNVVNLSNPTKLGPNPEKDTKSWQKDAKHFPISPRTHKQLAH